MHRTSQKIREAEFFLTRMEEARGTEVFAFYLSAFVSAARSISWVFRAECKDLPGWLNWYEKRMPAPQELNLLKQLNAIRVRSQKFEPVEPGLRVQITIPPEHLTPTMRAALEAGATSCSNLTIDRLEDGQALIRIHEEQAAGEVHEVILTLAEFPDTDIQTVCTDYLRLVRGMVNEWCQKSAA